MRHKIPPLCRNGRGQAYVCIDRKARFLGRFDDPQARIRYDQLIAEWTGNNRSLLIADPKRTTVSELGRAFIVWAENHYRRPDGSPTGEAATLQTYVNELTGLYGDTPAADFGPNRLRALRQRFIEKGYTRKGVNRTTGRIRSIFK